MSATSLHSSSQARARVARILSRWVGWCHSHAWLVLIFSALLTAATFHYVRNNLGINTDDADMFSDRLAWRQSFLDYRTTFPQFNDTLLVVVDGVNPDVADRAARRLGKALREDHERVEWVYDPAAEPFFERNALLYLSEDELDDLSQRLATVQPVLGRLAADPTLVGLSEVVALAADAVATGESEIELSPLLEEMASVFTAERHGHFGELSWRKLMLGEGEVGGIPRRFVVVKPKLDYSKLLPGKAVVEQIRALRDELSLTSEHGVEVRVTGSIALSFEELKSVTRGAKTAGMLALLMVTVVLVGGLRSLRLVFATLVTLVFGLIWTAAFATAAIGTLNLISVAFAVLYIGLGVDYAIHFCLRYRELVLGGDDSATAIQTAAGDVGSSLLLCAITTGIGFYAFVPTDFSGVSELGLISGTGMFVSLAATLTVLPAVLGIAPLRRAQALRAGASWVRGLAAIPYRHGGAVVVIAILAGIGAALIATHLRFDHNPLNLRDPKAESVSTYVELLADPDASPWRLNVLADSLGAADRLASELEALEPIGRVTSLSRLVPEGQEFKLEVVDELALILGPELEATQGKAHDPDAQRAALAELREALKKLTAPAVTEDERTSAERALAALQALLPEGPEAIAPNTLRSLQTRLTAGLPDQLRRLESSLDAQSVAAEDLPEAMRHRWVSADGRYRVELTAAGNLDDAHTLRDFVEAAQSVAPNAIGPPAVQVGSANAVVGAFRQAYASALVLVAVLLVVLLGRARDAGLVLTPLLLATTLTMAGMVAVGVPFNFANVIALPLLLGVGVDNGVHIAHRRRSAPPADGNLLMTSTARGVIVSALTTICSFGNLAFSPHRGMASMGIVLTIGMLMTLICTLAVLPAMMRNRPD